MIYLDQNKKEPLYLQLYFQLRNEINSGILSENTVLTGSRELAKTLQVSRNTVDSAYGQLAAEGYIWAKKGIGFVVAKLPENLSKANSGFAKPSNIQTRSTSIPSQAKARPTTEVIYDLTNSSHTSDLFPKTAWRKYTLECMDLLEQEEKISTYQDKQGELYLRQNLLAYLERIRGVHCDVNQIIITSGLQQSLDILCKLLSHQKSYILMEEPGYNKAVAVFRNNQLTVQTIPVDENGLLVSDLPDETNDICALYCTPSHQFPTGVTLPIDRRYQLLEWANTHKVYLIEDDFDSEQRYYAKPIPSLSSIDSMGIVIYLGTFSKAVSPSIRMGYMILPSALMTSYQKMYESYNSTAPMLNQYVIGKMFETGEYDRHIRRLNLVFKKRMELFLSEFADWKDYITLSGNRTGQYFLLQFHSQVSQEELIQAALSQGVRVYPTMQFWQDKADCPPNTLFIGFSKIDLKDIPDCAMRLKKAWEIFIASETIYRRDSKSNRVITSSMNEEKILWK